MLRTYDETEQAMKRILAKLKSANSETAERFKLGAGNLSIVYTIDEKTDGILYSADFVGNVYSCRTEGTNKFPTITRN